MLTAPTGFALIPLTIPGLVVLHHLDSNQRRLVPLTRPAIERMASKMAAA